MSWEKFSIPDTKIGSDVFLVIVYVVAYIQALTMAYSYCRVVLLKHDALWKPHNCQKVYMEVGRGAGRPQQVTESPPQAAATMVTFNKKWEKKKKLQQQQSSYDKLF